MLFFVVVVSWPSSRALHICKSAIQLYTGKSLYEFIQ